MKAKGTNDNNSEMFFHCGLCLNELDQVRKKEPKSPREYAELEVGWTKEGIQIWCKRHNCNVIHINFGGRKMEADTTRKELITH